MASRRFDLVVFDWDGTVVDSTAMIALSIQKAAADLGLRVPTREQASHVIGLGLHEALAGAVPDLDASRIEEFSARYRHHYFAGEPEIVLFGGVRELLVELAEGGARLAVATGKSRRGLDRAFGATGLGVFFAASRCADETHPKPHPAMLLELTEELDVPVERTVMIEICRHKVACRRQARISNASSERSVAVSTEHLDAASKSKMSNVKNSVAVDILNSYP